VKRLGLIDLIGTCLRTVVVLVVSGRLPMAPEYRIIHRSSTKNCIHVEVAVFALSLKVGKCGWKFLPNITRSPDLTLPISSQAPPQSLLDVE
jgi:hypothetical protein